MAAVVLTRLLLLAQVALVAQSQTTFPGSASFVVPTAFPSSVYSSYYGEFGP